MFNKANTKDYDCKPLTGKEISPSEPIYGKKRPSKVTIVGFAGDYNTVNWEDKDQEIWIINGLYRMITDIPGAWFDRVFDIHSRFDIIDQDDDGHVEALNKFIAEGKKVYTCEVMPELPGSLLYPLADVENFCSCRYWTNTISYLIALAAYEKFSGTWSNLQELKLYGVYMSQNSEYAHQRPSCEYFLGYCRGLGMKVTISPASDLLKCALRYGFDSNPYKTVIFRNKRKDYNKLLKDFVDNKNMEIKKYDNYCGQLSAGYNEAMVNENDIEKRKEILASYNNQLGQANEVFRANLQHYDAGINQMRSALDVTDYYERLLFVEEEGMIPYAPSVDFQTHNKLVAEAKADLQAARETV